MWSQRGKGGWRGRAAGQCPRLPSLSICSHIDPKGPPLWEGLKGSEGLEGREGGRGPSRAGLSPPCRRPLHPRGQVDAARGLNTRHKWLPAHDCTLQAPLHPCRVVGVGGGVPANDGTTCLPFPEVPGVGVGGWVRAAQGLGRWGPAMTASYCSSNSGEPGKRTPLRSYLRIEGLEGCPGKGGWVADDRGKGRKGTEARSNNTRY